MFEGQKKNNEGKDAKGLFEAGNQLWRQRKRHGPRRMFETPEELQAACFEYFDWADANPLQEEKVFGTGLKAKVAHPRALTQRGLCVYIGMTQQAWRRYRENPTFAELCEMVEDIIFEQKFAGAAAGIFNATIISRDLGLTDKTDHLSSDGSMTPVFNTIYEDKPEGLEKSRALREENSND